MRMQMMQQMQPWMGMMGPMGMMGMPPPNNGSIPPNPQQQPSHPMGGMPGFNPMAAMMMPPFMGMNPMMPGMRVPPNNLHLNHRPNVPPVISTDRSAEEVLPPPKNLRGKKGSKRKAAGKPKRPLSAYNLFFRDERARILNTLPGKDGQEGDDKDEEGKSEKVMKEEEKDTQDPEAKTTADDEPKDPQAKNDDTPDNEASTKDNPKFKGKKTPHGKIGFESLAKLIGKRWQELPSDEVDKYKKLADADAVRYRAEMEVFLTKDVNEDGRVAKKPKLNFGI